MLSSKQIEGSSRPYVGFVNTLSRITAEEGFGALFKGIVPRVMWLSIGGSIFLGAYEMAISLLHQQHTNNIGMESKLQQ
jgi:solute carrier family 25 S-adenosylmethionine transporter 26